mmetsp:Transcript_21584/g.42388  ORF Transcript_21584/g.42388 Transcript_21584/m.42388 type:complete len:447 (-) Transcript_21584:40-1380(-)
MIIKRRRGYCIYECSNSHEHLLDCEQDKWGTYTGVSPTYNLLKANKRVCMWSEESSLLGADSLLLRVLGLLSDGTLKADLGVVDGVDHEHSNGHGANTTGDGCDGASDLASSLVVNITAHAHTALAGGVLLKVNTNVDDGGTRLDPVTLDELGLANGSNEDISLTAHLLEIRSAGVANAYSGMSVEEHECRREANNVAASKNNSLLAGNLTAGLLEEHDGSKRGAGGVTALKGQELAALLAKVLTTTSQAAHVERVEAVNVLLHIDGLKNGGLVALSGQRKLNQNTIYILAGIEVTHDFEHLLMSASAGEKSLDGADSNLGSSLFLHLDILGGVGAVTDENDGESGGGLLAVAGAECIDILLDVSKNLAGNSLAVDDGGNASAVGAERTGQGRGGEGMAATGESKSSAHFARLRSLFVCLLVCQRAGEESFASLAEALGARVEVLL